VLVSPAEPPALKTLGRTSTLPETLGADFLFYSPLFGRVGVQRKAIPDLVSSLSDGRLQREIIDMKGLDVGIWLIEGRPEWTTDGQLLGSRSTYTEAQHFGVVFSLLSKTFWVVQTGSQPETLRCLSALERWLKKPSHHSLNSRPGPSGMFGLSKTDWQVHFMQGLPGVGYERARAAVEHFGGLPMKLTGDLSEVSGIGKKTAARVSEMFDGT
jgi:ERCC4-type nuclease